MLKKTNAGRKCSICTHEKAEEINSGIARRDSFRAISCHFFGSESARESIRRHTENCLKLDIAALVEEKRIERAIDAHQEFAEQLAFAREMRIAARAYLNHPETNEICFFPRSDEIHVVYEDYRDLSNKGEPKKKTDTLDILLERVKTGSVEPTRTIVKHTDMREFGLRTISTADACIDRFARIQGVYEKDNQQKQPQTIYAVQVRQNLISAVMKLDATPEQRHLIYQQAIPSAVQTAREIGKPVSEEDLRVEVWELVV